MIWNVYSFVFCHSIRFYLKEINFFLTFLFLFVFFFLFNSISKVFLSISLRVEIYWARQKHLFSSCFIYLFFFLLHISTLLYNRKLQETQAIQLFFQKDRVTYTYQDILNKMLSHSSIHFKTLRESNSVQLYNILLYFVDGSFIPLLKRRCCILFKD